MMSIEAENMADEAHTMNERAGSDYDSEYIQTKLSSYVNSIDGPEALEDTVLLQSQWKRGGNRIYDADGDGVEDNIKKTADDLDNFFIPAVFGDAEDMFNTHHGNLPGHVQ